MEIERDFPEKTEYQGYLLGPQISKNHYHLSQKGSNFNLLIHYNRYVGFYNKGAWKSLWNQVR